MFFLFLFRSLWEYKSLISILDEVDGAKLLTDNKSHNSTLKVVSVYPSSTQPSIRRLSARWTLQQRRTHCAFFFHEDGDVLGGRGRGYTSFFGKYFFLLSKVKIRYLRAVKQRYIGAFSFIEFFIYPVIALPLKVFFFRFFVCQSYWQCILLLQLSAGVQLIVSLMIYHLSKMYSRHHAT